jgi:putative SOS response-associated peptidase YedK
VRSASFASSPPRRGQDGKQPYAIATKDRSPFGVAGLWENWKDRATGEWTQTFAILTTPANDLVARIYDRMPVILNSGAYERWLGIELDPHDLLVPLPSDVLVTWPIQNE